MKKILFVVVFLVTTSVIVVQSYFAKKSSDQFSQREMLHITKESLAGLHILKIFLDEHKVALKLNKNSDVFSFNKSQIANLEDLKEFNLSETRLQNAFKKNNIFELLASNKDAKKFLLLSKEKDIFKAKKIFFKSNNIRYLSKLLQNGIIFQKLTKPQKLKSFNIFFENKKVKVHHITTKYFVDIYLQVAEDSYMKISINRTFRQLMKENTYYSILFYTIIILALFLIFYLFVNKIVFSKIWIISDKLQELQNTKDFSIRVNIEGKDEISQMAMWIDKAIASIEILRQQELAQKDQEIEKEKRFLQQIIDSSNHSILVTNENDIIKINHSFKCLFGHILNQDKNDMKKDFFNSVLNAKKNEIINLKCSDEKCYFFKIDKTYLSTKSQQLITITDVSKLGEELSSLKKSSVLDPLTKTLNRNGLMKQFSDLFNDTTFGLLLFDIDFFKHINDTYGHPVGDKVLVVFANLLKQNSRQEEDIVCRFGGEEFLIIFDCHDNDILLSKAEKIRKQAQELLIDSKIKFTISIGGIIGHNNDKFDEYYEIADKNLYKAKKSGRNKTIITRLKEYEKQEEKPLVKP